MTPPPWASPKDLLRGFHARVKTQPDRLAILDAVWEREAGHFSRHWRLLGVRRGVLYVACSSPAAAQELQLRAPGLLRELNKHFRSAWIKAVRPRPEGR